MISAPVCAGLKIGLDSPRFLFGSMDRVWHGLGRVWMWSGRTWVGSGRVWLGLAGPGGSGRIQWAQLHIRFVV